MGDFIFGPNKIENSKRIRERINCERLILVQGNHDDWIRKNKNKEDFTKLFAEVHEFHYRKLNNQFIVMCHFAMRTWCWQAQGSWDLYAHSHGSLADDPNSLSLDVGVDTCLYGHEKYTPYSFEELQGIMSQKKNLQVDHHGRNTPAK